jgi:hypothetical protein
VLVEPAGVAVLSLVCCVDVAVDVAWEAVLVAFAVVGVGVEHGTAELALVCSVDAVVIELAWAVVVVLADLVFGVEKPMIELVGCKAVGGSQPKSR